jgi:hypothetical protein
MENNNNNNKTYNSKKNDDTNIIFNNLIETKNIMVENVGLLITRGNKLDETLERSKKLKYESLLFASEVNWNNYNLFMKLLYFINPFNYCCIN